MPKLPRVSGVRIIRALERLGFFQIRQRGSHVVLRKETLDGVIGCVVPLHREVKVGTLQSILNQAQVTNAEFMAALND